MQSEPYDAIIVPGIPYPYENGNWHPVMKIRVYWSEYLYKKGIAKNIIYSGSAVYTPYVESKIMALYGEALGIPKENIFAETKAEHSTENLYYSYKMAQKMGFKRIALATDPYQDKLLRRFGKKFKLDVTHIPIVFDTLKQINKIDPKIIDSTAQVQNFISITERESFWKRWKGTLGKNINFEEE
ncbi:MAG: YdcF family protein [Sporocytophaga sp.]|nr:YdcF family protein [Sporocytophaga sp.]